MGFYEVIVAVVSGGKEICRKIVQLPAKNKFDAAIRAEDALDGVYGDTAYARFVSLSRISASEYHAAEAA